MWHDSPHTAKLAHITPSLPLCALSRLLASLPHCTTSIVMQLLTGHMALNAFLKKFMPLTQYSVLTAGHTRPCPISYCTALSLFPSIDPSKPKLVLSALLFQECLVMLSVCLICCTTLLTQSGLRLCQCSPLSHSVVPFAPPTLPGIQSSLIVFSFLSIP